jgi:hypothetical protein
MNFSICILNIKKIKKICDELFPNVEDQVLVEKQLIAYRNLQGSFFDCVALAMAKAMPTHQW